MSLLKETTTKSKTIRKLWIGVAIVLAVVLGGIAVGKAYGATAVPGWQDVTPTVKELSHLKVIATTGDQGGEIALICNTQTKRLNITYSFEGKQYDFFVIRNFGDTSQDASTKMIVGAGIYTQADIFWHLMRDEYAFSVGRFPVGSKKLWGDAVDKTKREGTNVPPPNLQQEGEEYFIAGPQIKLLLNQIGAYCPMNAEDKRPVL